MCSRAVGSSTLLQRLVRMSHGLRQGRRAVGLVLAGLNWTACAQAADPRGLLRHTCGHVLHSPHIHTCSCNESSPRLACAPPPMQSTRKHMQPACLPACSSSRALRTTKGSTHTAVPAGSPQAIRPAQGINRSIPCGVVCVQASKSTELHRLSLSGACCSFAAQANTQHVYRNTTHHPRTKNLLGDNVQDRATVSLGELANINAQPAPAARASASCRPYLPAAGATTGKPGRVARYTYKAALPWVHHQIGSCTCTCCLVMVMRHRLQIPLDVPVPALHCHHRQQATTAAPCVCPGARSNSWTSSAGATAVLRCIDPMPLQGRRPCPLCQQSQTCLSTPATNCLRANPSGLPPCCMPARPAGMHGPGKSCMPGTPALVTSPKHPYVRPAPQNAVRRVTCCTTH